MLSTLLWRARKQVLQLIAKSAQDFEALRGRFDDLLLVLKDLPTLFRHQHPNCFPHPPAWCPEYLQPIDARHKERDTTVADDAHTLGKAIESLEFETGEIDALELFGGIQDKALSSGLRASREFATARTQCLRETHGSQLAAGSITSCTVPYPRHSAPPATSEALRRLRGPRRW